MSDTQPNVDELAPIEWLLDDLVTTILDAAPEELPKLHAKLTALAESIDSRQPIRQAKKDLLAEVREKINNSHLSRAVEYTGTHRQVGHTTATIIGASPTQNEREVMVMVANNMQRKYLSKYIDPKNIVLPSSNLKGYNRPLLIDHFALESMFAELTQALAAIKEIEEGL